jgi:NAD(P)H-dependent flavin oxidoreductase YrpB (nitropropane dioxygenase family)
MALPPVLQRLKLPVIGAPMFIAGNPKLVVEQCKAGIVGSFPALNARPKEALDAWLTEIEQALARNPDAAPYAVNQIVHKSNDRLEHDLEVCIHHRVPITITSLRAPNDVIPAIHACGGFDPLNLPKSDPKKMNFGSAGGAEKKVWRDIWSAGQGVGQIEAVLPVAEVVAKLAAEYTAARRRLALS